MANRFCTLARLCVVPRQEDAFVAAWHDLAAFFLALKQPPRWGTPLRSFDDPRLFYSFGPWSSTETIAATRADPGVPAAIAKLTALCEEAELGTFLVAAVAGESPPVA